VEGLPEKKIQAVIWPTINVTDPPIEDRHHEDREQAAIILTAKGTADKRPPLPASAFVTIAIRPSSIEAGYAERCR